MEVFFGKGGKIERRKVEKRIKRGRSERSNIGQKRKKEVRKREREKI